MGLSLTQKTLTGTLDSRLFANLAQITAKSVLYCHRYKSYICDSSAEEKLHCVGEKYGKLSDSGRD